MRSLLFAVILGIFSLSSSTLGYGGGAETEKMEYDGEWLIIDRGSYVCVAGYMGSDDDLTVPSEIRGKTVKEISVGLNGTYIDEDTKNTFFSGGLTPLSVTVPDTVKVIGKGVFKDCTRLEKVVLSEGLEIIDDYAFYGCLSLKTVRLPSTVEKIGNSCFEESSLSDGVVLNQGLKYIGMGAFEYTGIRELDIPETVSYIGPWAFRACEELEAVTLPKGLTDIRASLFAYCKSIREITVPEGVKRIGLYVFHFCTSLERIYFPADLTFSYDVFLENPSLTDIYFKTDRDYIRTVVGEDSLKRMVGSTEVKYGNDIKLHYEPIAETETAPIGEEIYKTVLRIAAITVSAAFLLLLAVYGALKLKNRPKIVPSTTSSKAAVSLLSSGESKKCSRCGAEYGDMASYCYNCGKKIKKG